MDRKNQSVTASWINVAAGVWLIIAPFILGYVHSTPFWNDIIVGAVVGVFALIRAFSPTSSGWLSWVNIISGAWLIVAPFILSYANLTPLYNDIILGVIVGGIAIWNLVAGSTTTTGRHVGV